MNWGYELATTLSGFDGCYGVLYCASRLTSALMLPAAPAPGQCLKRGRGFLKSSGSGYFIKPPIIKFVKTRRGDVTLRYSLPCGRCPPIRAGQAFRKGYTECYLRLRILIPPFSFSIPYHHLHHGIQAYKHLTPLHRFLSVRVYFNIARQSEGNNESI